VRSVANPIVFARRKKKGEGETYTSLVEREKKKGKGEKEKKKGKATRGNKVAFPKRRREKPRRGSGGAQAATWEGPFLSTVFPGSCQLFVWKSEAKRKRGVSFSGVCEEKKHGVSPSIIGRRQRPNSQRGEDTRKTEQKKKKERGGKKASLTVNRLNGRKGWKGRCLDKGKKIDPGRKKSGRRKGRRLDLIAHLCFVTPPQKKRGQGASTPTKGG